VFSQKWAYFDCTLSTSAAAVALPLDKLAWLWSGSNKIDALSGGQLNDLRTSFDTLQSYDPEIANELLSVARSLENAASRAESSLITTSLPTNIRRLTSAWGSCFLVLFNFPDESEMNSIRR